MRFYLILLLLCLCRQILLGQFGPQQIISTNVDGTKDVFTADIDSDGDLDIISTAEFDDKVSWFENIDGLGVFGPEQIINETLHAAYGIYVSDIDNDSFLDIIIAAKGHNANDGKVYWIKNLDGLGNFGEPQIISTLVQGPLSVFVADIDGDNNLDVVSASFADNKVAWYQNIDGLGNFGPQQVIDNQALSVRQVFVADLDGDTDMDVIAAAAAADEVIWYENTDGLGTYGVPQILTNTANGVISVYATDIDGDEDLDILAASPSDNEVIWFENTNGQASFGPKQILAVNLQVVRDVKATDIDNDGDMDVLFAYVTTNPNGAIAWAENLNGVGTFGKPQVISSDLVFAVMAYPCDLDNDGDQDVISVSSGDDKVAWYENLTILGNHDFKSLGIKIYPNPVNELLVIESPIPLQNVTIYNVLGIKLLEISENLNEIPMANLPNGLLLLEVTTEKGTFVEKVVKE